MGRPLRAASDDIAYPVSNRVRDRGYYYWGRLFEEAAGGVVWRMIFPSTR